MNGEIDKSKDYVDGVLVKAFETQYGIAFSLHFIDEDAFIQWFLSKMGSQKGGLRLVAYKKANPTEHTTHSLRINPTNKKINANIEADFSKPSDNHLDQIDDSNPF